LTGDVTTSAGSLATTYNGIVPAAKGGAGTINGALKGNGSGVVSQAACADLSNGATGCSTAVVAPTSYTPSVTCSSGGPPTVGSATGNYTQIGKAVTFDFNVQITAWASACAGFLIISTPTTVANVTSIAGKETDQSGKMLSLNAGAGGTGFVVQYYDGVNLPSVAITTSPRFTGGGGYIAQ
jgi:hypothetical protein